MNTNARTCSYSNVTKTNARTQVRKWQKQGHVVAVVGDGVNDAAAMVCADVGVGIGADAFVTGCADITIVGDKFDRNVRNFNFFLQTFILSLSQYIFIRTQVLQGIDRSIHISRRVCEVATRGATYGFGASLLTMLTSGFGSYAGCGNVSPFGASLIQEFLDVASLIYSASVLIC